MKTITKSDMPFTKKPWIEAMDEHSVDDLMHYDTCAVVTSSSSLLTSEFGNEIDGHDAVFRFSREKADKYLKYVGNKTTFILINAWMLEFNRDKVSKIIEGTENVLYFNPSLYGHNLRMWYRFPEFKSFSYLPKFSKQHPRQKFFVVDPTRIWQIWDFYRDYNYQPIHPKIPTAGSIALFTALRICNSVTLYGFLPSHKADIHQCYYYNTTKNLGCTYGNYHPTLYEKNVVAQMNMGSVEDVINYGKVTLPGYSNLTCSHADDVEPS